MAQTENSLTPLWSSGIPRIFCPGPKDETRLACYRLSNRVTSERWKRFLVVRGAHFPGRSHKDIRAGAIFEQERLFGFRSAPALRAIPVNDRQKCVSLFNLNSLARKSWRTCSGKRNSARVFQRPIGKLAVDVSQ